MNTAAWQELVRRQHCIPWKLRLMVRAVVPWRVRRWLIHGRANLNTPEAMDRRYARQDDAFVSMENLYAQILPMLSQRGRLLDAGCGIAVLLRTIRATYPALELHGVDFSPVAVERTRRYGFIAHQTTLPLLPYADGFFDVVTCTEVLEHLDVPIDTVRAFRRVLRPGGRLIVSVPCGMGPDACDEHVHDFTEETLRNCLSDGGLSVKSIDLIDREPHRKPGASYLALALKESNASSR